MYELGSFSSLAVMQDLAVQDLAFGRFMYFSKVKRYKLWLMFMAPVTIVRRIKICPCPSVRPSVRPSVSPSVRPFVTLYGT